MGAYISKDDKREPLEFVTICAKADGTLKGYIRFEPQQTNRIRPLLLVFPDLRRDAEQMRSLTNYGFEDCAYSPILAPIVIYLEDSHKNGFYDRENVCERPAIDEFSFVRLCIETELARGCIDPRLIFATGMGAGGSLLFSLPSKCGDLICAIAPICALIPKTFLDSNWPLPCPVCFVIGDQDPFVPTSGIPLNRIIPNAAQINRSVIQKRMLSASAGLQASMEYIARQNNVISPHVEVDGKIYHPATVLDSTVIQLYDSPYALPTGQPAVKMFPKGSPALRVYVVKGGGHGWPGGKKLLPKDKYGKTSRNLDTCHAVWAFFSEVALSI